MKSRVAERSGRSTFTATSLRRWASRARKTAHPTGSEVGDKFVPTVKYVLDQPLGLEGVVEVRQILHAPKILTPRLHVNAHAARPCTGPVKGSHPLTTT